MTQTYLQARDENALTQTRIPVWILEFTDLPQTPRLVSRPDYLHADATKPAPTPGLVVKNAVSASVRLTTNTFDMDDLRVEIVDPGDVLAQSFALSDTILNTSQVILRHGFLGVAEEDFQDLTLYVTDWGKTTRGVLQIRLRTALKFLDRPLFEDIESEGTLAVTLQPGDTEIQIEIDATAAEGGADWRIPGFAVIVDSDTDEIELVSYTGIERQGPDLSTLTGVTRRQEHGGTTSTDGWGNILRKIDFRTGKASKVFTADEADVKQAWNLGVNLATGIFLMMALTTDTAGENGVWDLGTGDGLGELVPESALDVQDILTTGALALGSQSGTVRLGFYFGTEEIESVLEFWEEEFLALGLRFAITRNGKLTVRQNPDLRDTPTDIAGQVEYEPRKLVAFKRGFERAENNLILRYTQNAGTTQFLSKVERMDDRSAERYGKSKEMEIHAFGCFGSLGRAHGIPDFGWDRFFERQASIYLREYGNPSEPVKLKGFLSAQDQETGDLVTYTHVGAFDLDAGRTGAVGRLAYVQKVEPKPKKADVDLVVRERRVIDRPLYQTPEPRATWEPYYRINLTTDSDEDEVEDWPNLPLRSYPVAGFRIAGTYDAVGWDTTFAMDTRDRSAQGNPTLQDTYDSRYDSFHFFVNNDAGGNVRRFWLRVDDDPLALYRVRFVMADTVGQVETVWLQSRMIASDYALPAGAAKFYEEIVGPVLKSGERRIEIILGGGVTPGNSVLNWISVEKLTIPAGYAELYRLNFGGPYDYDLSQVVVDPLVDDWVFASQEVFPTAGLGVGETRESGWVEDSPPTWTIRYAGVDSPNGMFDSFIVQPNAVVGGRTYRLRVPKGTYLVHAILGDAFPNSSAQHFLYVNGKNFYDLIVPGTVRSDANPGLGRAVSQPLGPFWFSKAVEIDAAEGLLEVRLGADPGFGGNSLLCGLRVYGRSRRSLSRFSFGFHGLGRGAQGYRNVAAGDTYSAATGYGWTDTPGMIERERSDAILLAAGQKWDTLAGVFNASPGRPTFRVDVPEPGFYLVTIGTTDTYPTERIRVEVNGVAVIDEDARPGLIAARTFQTFEKTVEAPDGFLEFRLGADDDLEPLNNFTRISWATIERTYYYEASAALRQFGFMAEDDNGFADGTLPYDMGV